jgi:hypothetical protein
MSQLRIAKIAGARRIVAERIAPTGCRYPDETARDIIDDLLKAGWTFPGWQLDDDVPQPSVSTVEGRRRAREIFEQTRAGKTTEGESA